MDQNQILDAVEKVRNGKTTSSKILAFRILAKAYKSDIDNAYHSILQYVKYREDNSNAYDFVLSIFSELIKAKHLQYPTISRLDSYIRSTLYVRVNKYTIRRFLGYNSPIKNLENVETAMDIAIKDFHITEHYTPDFDNEEDIKILASILGKSIKITKQYIMKYKIRVRSLDEPIAESQSGEEMQLGETIASKNPLPDGEYMESSRSRDMKNIIEGEEGKLSQNQRNVFKLFHNDDPDAAELTKEEISKKTGLPYVSVIHLLNSAKAKLARNKKLQEWAEPE